MKNTLDGGEAILEACRKLGVDYIISSPGTEWAPVWEAMANQIARGGDGPAFIDVWHETLAVNMAAGYTLATGKMQAVLLHAGGGLLQGAMGIHGAWSAGIPMVVISGETMTYGERPDFDPGPQWINNLSIVGGTTRLVEPVVKYAGQAGSPYVLYESVVRAGELAQRAPTGPTYLSVSTETLMEPWTPPKHARTVPPAPQRPDPARGHRPAGPAARAGEEPAGDRGGRRLRRRDLRRAGRALRAARAAGRENRRDRPSPISRRTIRCTRGTTRSRSARTRTSSSSSARARLGIRRATGRRTRRSR